MVEDLADEAITHEEAPMRILPRRPGYALLPLVALSLLGCVTQEQKDRASIEAFKEATTGTWVSDGGAELMMVPVRARMVTDEAIYVERLDSKGVVGRLLNLQMSEDGRKVLQRALAFKNDGQWRDIRDNPELLTALLPKDVRPAGTCDIQVSDDANSVSFSCGGSTPETFKRK
jgi:hypothetical protein